MAGNDLPVRPVRGARFGLRHGLRVAIAILRGVTRRDVVTEEIREEMRFHVDMRAVELERRGVDAATAHRFAAQRFGNFALMQDRGYDVRGGGLMDTIVQDIRFGLRLLLKHRAFSLAAILTLAVGIGVSAALFSVIDSALLRPLPYPHPEQLVSIDVEVPNNSGGTSRYAPSMSDVRAWRDAVSVLSHIGAGRVGGFMPLIVDAGTPERRKVGDPSEDFLETYGVTPVIGRALTESDTREGAPAVALLGYSYWQTRLAGDAAVIGRTIRIDGTPTTVVGVVQKGFYPDTAIWRPQQFQASFLNRRGSGKPVVARLQPGITIETAAKELTRLAAADITNGPTPVAPRVLLTSLYADETRGYGATIRTLAWAVSLLLAIACVNVTGLLLARGTIREGELAIRASIGAGRGRLIRQLLTESLLVAMAAGVLGVCCAWLTLDALVSILPLSLPENSPPTINLFVLGSALALACATAVIIGLMPAISLSRAGQTLGTHLSTAGRRVGSSFSKRRGQLLVSLQVAVALVLLSGSGLAARSLARLLAVDVGYDPDRVLTMEVEPLDQSGDVRARYYADLVQTLRAAPEFEAISAIDQISLGGGGSYRFPTTETGQAVSGPQRTIMPGYFEALGVRPIAGRLLADGDSSSGESPVVINDVSARTFFNDAPIGQTVRTDGKDARVFRIVGVVRNIRHGGPQSRVQPEMYMLPEPAVGGRDEWRTTMAIVMRLRKGASISEKRLHEMAESIGPRVLVGRIRSAHELVGEKVATPRNRVVLFSVLGGFGLALTLVGVFSVTAYAVARRTREIGIRTAFGARPHQLVMAFVADAAKPTAIGILLGVAGAYYATRLLKPFLFQTTPGEPATLAVVAGVIGVATCLAAWIPARRATRVDPVIALRAD